MAPRRRRPQPGGLPPLQGPLTPGLLGPLAPPAPPLALVFPYAGFLYQAGDLDKLITLPLLACARLPMFRAQLVGGQSIAGNTATVMAFDTILEDPWGGWSPTSTGTQAANSWQPPFDGTYEVVVGVNTAAGAVSVLGAGIAVNGGSYVQYGAGQSDAAISGGAGCTVLKSLAGGVDYVQGATRGTQAFSLAAGGAPRASSMEIFLVSL